MPVSSSNGWPLLDLIEERMSAFICVMQPKAVDRLPTEVAGRGGEGQVIFVERVRRVVDDVQRRNEFDVDEDWNDQ